MREMKKAMTLKLIPSRNKKNYYKIYLEDEFLGSLPQKLIPAEYFLQASSTIADDAWQPSVSNDFIKFVKEWVHNNALSLLLDYLAKMERTTNDCKIYLRRWDVPEEVISSAIEQAKQKKWVSNERYAELYVEEAALAGRSPLDAKHKLLRKKVSSDVIDKVINNAYDRETKETIIKELIEKLMSRYAELHPSKQFEKIATALYRKGFEYGDYEELLRGRIKTSLLF